MTRITRSDLLRRAALTGGAALGAGAAAGWLVSTAAARPPDEDLAWVRFGVAAEFVVAQFYRQARRSGFFRDREAFALQRGGAAELAHQRAFRQLLIDAGQVPIDDEDLEVVFADDAFSSRTKIVSLGRRLTGMTLHAYLGAVETVGDGATRRVLGQVAASSAAQLAFFTGPGSIAADPFPTVHGLDTASVELSVYLP